MTNRPIANAFNITNKQGAGAEWNEVGAAFPHNDGNGFNIPLEVIPSTSKITLRYNHTLGESALRTQALIAYAVISRGQTTFWRPIGTATPHADNKGHTLDVFAYPKDGNIVVRAFKEDRIATPDVDQEVEAA